MGGVARIDGTYGTAGLVRDLLMEEYYVVPVFVPQAAMDRFYLGFCNRHSLAALPLLPQLRAIRYGELGTYRDVQEDFAQAVRDQLKPGDVVWIHDYHLMLLPAMLRQDFPDLSIGFFLHIPFPSYEIFACPPACGAGSCWRGCWAPI